jgi:hypothetical protein
VIPTSREGNLSPLPHSMFMRTYPLCVRNNPCTTISVQEVINTSVSVQEVITREIITMLIVTLREEHRLRVFENRVLRRIFGPKRDEVTRGRRKLYNDEIHSLCTLHQIILG